ncbi:MAG TPA: LPS assembly lipoprotein LptE [Vicinamibacterales bacterium]|nr:LPS assembly lipoprotein LptE [Vicinamibacterales bacterium]HOQ60758.1 LPS assembly lipoprotein LptE [Vicinamibacterales bacterium]HPK72711.1 LPS assembly lipoprotein LptE [Vicinamibacterales bacterium]HPW21089.1 LPS assembly lipoprotein LptE [Vicinamibacterales bacterium]
MRRAPAVLLAVLLALAPVACGYSLAGRGSFLPSYIRVIGVPEFVNQTSYPDVERRFSERVRSEFIGRGRYRVLPQDTGVDAVLRGTITSMSLVPSTFNESQQATRYTVVVNTRIEFVDLTTNKTLWENPSMVYREEYELPADTQAGNPSAFFGQGSNALERVANDFARSVVSAILEAF